jgi:hypothetical protein
VHKRKLKDGSEVDSFDHPIDLIIHTKAPGKWLVIDLETGQEYIGSAITHPSFGETLRQKVMECKIGSWVKTKDKNGNNVI